MSTTEENLTFVYFDESGNTGPDLLHVAQPIFALASVNLSDSEAREMVEPLIDDTGELKFSTIRRDPTRRKQLLTVLNSESLRPSTARVSVFHKPYMTVAKLVDLLMEPGFYRRGLAEQWRTDGSTLRWPATLYEIAPEQLGEIWDRLLEAFIRAVRKGSADNASEVADLIDRALATEPDARIEFPLTVMRDEVTEALSIYYDSGGRPRKDPVDPLDPAVTGLIEHLDHWGQAVGPFIARHDAASALERSLPYIEALCDPTIEPYEVTGSDGVAKFPLQARRIEFVDSQAFPQIQLADLLAGACTFQQGAAEPSGRDPALAQALAETNVRGLFAQFIAPPEFVRASMSGLL